ncbi:MAG: translocation/assembly module TamB [Waddliaceae bacterium]
MKSILRTLIFTAFIGFFVLSALLHSQSVKQRVVNFLQEQIAAKTGRRVEIDQLTLYPAPLLKASGITVYDHQGDVLFFIDECAVQFSLLPLLKTDIHLMFQLVKEEEEWQGNLTYEKGQGRFSLATDNTWMLTGSYQFRPDGMVDISRFHAAWGSLALGGDLLLAGDGSIHTSSFFVECEDASQLFSAKGQFYGEGSLSGHLLSPKIQAVLRSDAMDFNGNTFKEPMVAVSPNHISLSFLKDGMSYRFSGDLAWEDEGALPSRLNMHTSLDTLRRLFALDWIDLSGQVNVELFRSEEGITGRTQLAAEDESGGKYAGNGRFAWSPQNRFPYTFMLDIEHAPILEMDNLSGRVDGHLTFTGTADEGKVEGNLITQSIIASLPEKTSDPLEELEITYINAPDDDVASSPSQDHSPAWPLHLEITLIIPGNGKILSRELSSEWKGEVVITGTADAPLLNGECKLIRGKYLMKGKTFTLKEGAVAFGGDVGKNSKLYVVAGYDKENISIEAVVRGNLSHPTLSFRSSPPLSQKEIFSWLLFNKRIEDISPFQGKQLMRSISDLSSDGPDLLSSLGDVLGIDHLDISGFDAEDPTKVSVRLGKYITEGTLLSLTHHFFGHSHQDKETNLLGVETDIGRYLKFQAEMSDDAKNGQLNILWKRDY